MLDIINIRKIFYFLGLPEGELVKLVFELILFILITYMVVSEFSRDKRRDLRYLIVAFSSLSFHRLVSTVVLASIVFGRLGLTTYYFYFPVLNNALEVFALILLANAFLFPILVSKFKTLKLNIRAQIFLLSVIFILLQVSLFVEIIYFGVDFGDFTNYLGGLIFGVMKIVLLLYAIFVLASRTDKPYPYRYSLIMAFLVYSVAPLLKLINLVFYGDGSARLFVASHPFPLIAVLLFTRVIYLKLVDKAFLKKKLRSTEEKYIHEKELSELKDKFVSIVSHELRTPLTAIKLHSSLLNRIGRLNKKQNDSVIIIRDETTRLAGLVNDILDLSKLESKGPKLCVDSFDLFNFISKSMFFSLAEDKGIKMVNCVPKGFLLKVDSDRFKQVLINLISNAIKFTDEGSVSIFARKFGDKCQVDIVDTGNGIPPEAVNKIFDKFFQAEHYMTRKQGGSGLGLTIANEIVKLHGGEIKVKSELGKGSTFSVFI